MHSLIQIFRKTLTSINFKFFLKLNLTKPVVLLIENP
ncbi:hypothetical protein BAZSYMB_SCAFFOLD00011_21 [Bathymodiolus azoricus thioautotrophic gill symbiont]|uniref:Uncharacterized protein n=1 Tax=Bathymodiolus azoricus thioautotrophic gill symbiont TaxID=235205 RepID=A0A1H6M185_9GAMM|nr:hypothetical protein BAZSYMB_SCAFFOLD00011_21 [Bathymodiolus azoricus thioautotrophic gill symbiont]